MEKKETNTTRVFLFCSTKKKKLKKKGYFVFHIRENYIFGFDLSGKKVLYIYIYIYIYNCFYPKKRK